MFYKLSNAKINQVCFIISNIFLWRHFCRTDLVLSSFHLLDNFFREHCFFSTPCSSLWAMMLETAISFMIGLRHITSTVVFLAIKPRDLDIPWFFPTVYNDATRIAIYWLLGTNYLVWPQGMTWQLHFCYFWFPIFFFAPFKFPSMTVGFLSTSLHIAQQYCLQDLSEPLIGVKETSCFYQNASLVPSISLVVDKPWKEFVNLIYCILKFSFQDFQILLRPSYTKKIR